MQERKAGRSVKIDSTKLAMKVEASRIENVKDDDETVTFQLRSQRKVDPRKESAVSRVEGSRTTPRSMEIKRIVFRIGSLYR